MIRFSSFIELETGNGISLHDLMPDIKEVVTESGIKNGFVTITSQHTTTAISINENEELLIEDVKTFLTRLIPPRDHYLHNDIAMTYHSRFGRAGGAGGKYD